MSGLLIIATHTHTHTDYAGDYAHIAYNYITALCLIRLQDRSSQPVSRLLHQLLLVSFVVGASVHMVADAVQQRLLRAGAMPHLAIRQQPMLQVRPRDTKHCTTSLL